jgi:predicted DNA-binding protein|tara:strand:- start:390 stop:533 length:144 start_codon:yes stop_codon:yes gene_type:complete
MRTKTGMSLSVRMSDKMKSKVARLATENNATSAEVVRVAVEKYLKHK